MKVYKRVVSAMMVLVMCFCVVAGIITPVHASSTDRIKTFLKLAAGGAVTDEDISGLTTEQLVFLGVYLSNFYQPFGTEFGGSNDKIAENCKEDMIKALQNKLAFSDDMSAALVEYVLDMTRSSIQYLDLYSLEDGGWAKLEFPYANYLNYFRLMFGQSESVFNGFFANAKSGACNQFDTSAYYNYCSYDQSRYPHLESNHSMALIELLRASDAEAGGNFIDAFTITSSDGHIDLSHEDEATAGFTKFMWALNSSIGYTTADTGELNYLGDVFWEASSVTSHNIVHLSECPTYASYKSRINYPVYEDYKEFVDTLYLYLSMGFMCSVQFPYLDPEKFSEDGMEKFSFSFDAVPSGPDTTQYQIDFFTGSGETSEGLWPCANYWCLRDPSQTPFPKVALQQYDPAITTPDLLQLSGSLSIKVFEEDWEICETLMGLLTGKVKKIGFGYEKDGSVVIVSDATTTAALNNNVQYSPSQIQFMKCLETVDMSKGYGTNMFDFNVADAREDTEWDAEALEKLGDQLTNFNSLSANKELSLKATMWGQRMAVDCFGNIICMGANHQYIVIPACMNPYAWRAVDENGNDIGKPGEFLNIINAKNIIQTDKGMLSNVSPTGTYISNDSSVTYNSDKVKHFTAKINGYVETTSGYKGIGKMLTSSALKKNNEIPARIIRGRGEHMVEDNCWWPWAGDDIAKTAVKNIVKVFGELRPYDKTAIGSGSTEDAWGCWSDEYIPLLRKVDKIATSSGGGWVGNNSKVNILDGYVFIDNLGVYKNSDGSDHEFSAFNVEHYVNPSTGVAAGKIAGGVKAQGDFGSHAEMLISGQLNSLEGSSEQALCSIYTSYVYAYFYTEDNKADTIGKIGYRYAGENFPAPPSNAVELDLESVMVDLELTAIRDWTYYLLHPTKGFNYVTTLISNKLNHLLLGWHSDMVGTNGVGATAGTTKYRSSVGYVTMPDLSEIEWTDKLISFYQDCIPFLIIVIVVLMLLAFITGVLPLQRAAFAAVVMSAFLLLPTILINGLVQQSNSISQRIYGNKFTYWAMVQQESYATQIDEAANEVGSSGTSTYDNYLRTLYGLNEQVYSNQGNESVLLKWQAPKKMASLVLTSSDAQSLNGLDEVGKAMLYGMLGKAYGGQSYVDDEDAVYMYRSYIDISNFSRYIYRGINSGKVNSTDTPSTVKGVLSGSFDSSLRDSVYNIPYVYKTYRNSNYSGWGLTESSSSPNYNYITVPLSSKIVADAVRNSKDMTSWDSKDDLVAINQDLFNFGIPMFTNDTVNFDLETFAATGNITLEGNRDRYLALKEFMRSYSSESDYVGLAAYALYSENPFYYFSWKLYHDGLGYDSSLYNKNGYKDLLLSESNGGYFYMTEGNGGLKDFMDMKSLFTYIIPYMKECNDLVREWDDVYGIFIHEGVPTEEGHWQDVSGDAELTSKYWHNLNVSRLYCLYCPWVDIMYDCSYADAETITVMGKRVVIEDPLNPASYPRERPMIFSEAEMKSYGLSEADLTAAERIILKCNEDAQESMYELLNYYNFSDITLNTAAAMQCAFTFNTNFSESGVFEENHNIYPQSYDLANFSYDAFLRFMLSESTGEDMLDVSKSSGSASGETSGDFYERIVNRSSTTTVLLMLVLDVLAMYVLPALKMFFLVAAFVSCILIVFVSALQIEDNAKFFRKLASGFLLPLLKFFGITIALSLIVSLFMGSGNRSVTQTDDLSISLGDPAMLLLVMIAINLVVLILYWKILKTVVKDIQYNAKLSGNFASGVLGATVGFVAGAVSSSVGAAKSGVDSAVEGHRYRSTKRAIKNSGEKGSYPQDPPQQGTGVESPRASQRGSSPVDDKQDSTSQHGNHKAPSSTKPKGSTPNSASTTEEKRKKLDDTANAGAEKLRQKAEADKQQRYERYRQSAKRDFGHAMDADGKIDRSKLSAKERYKLDSRLDRSAKREASIQSGANQKSDTSGGAKTTKSSKASKPLPSKGSGGGSKPSVKKGPSGAKKAKSK